LSGSFNRRFGEFSMEFGTYLLKQKKINEGNLEDALQHQKYFPGRLGTQLVELRFLTLMDLEIVLGYFFEVPDASDQDLQNMDEFCRNMFPVESIEKVQFLPLEKTAEHFSVAMVNPKDLKAIEWLENSSELKLKIFSISEIRFSYFLFKHFNRELDQRIRNIYFGYLKDKIKNKLPKERVSDEEDRSIPIALENDKKDLEKLGIKPLADDEYLSDDSFEEMMEGAIMHYGSVPPPPSTESDIKFAKVPKI